MQTYGLQKKEMDKKYQIPMSKVIAD